jgi:hypothetical protein
MKVGEAIPGIGSPVVLRQGENSIAELSESYVGLQM